MPRNKHQRPQSEAFANSPMLPFFGLIQPIWDAREALLSLPREHTPEEKTELARLEAHLAKAGVLTFSTEF